MAQSHNTMYLSHLFARFDLGQSKRDVCASHKLQISHPTTEMVLYKHLPTSRVLWSRQPGTPPDGRGCQKLKQRRPRAHILRCPTADAPMNRAPAAVTTVHDANCILYASLPASAHLGSFGAGGSGRSVDSPQTCDLCTGV